MKKIVIVVTLIALFSIQINHAQKIKFGKVSKEELEEKFYPLDSSANAVIIYKKRSTYTTLLGGDIQLITDMHFRIKIYNKEGYDWASEKIFLRSGNKDERASSIKAYTYNLEGGEITKTKLEKDQIFSEKKSEYINAKKFTMPNLKEGCIVEWTYRVYSPFFWNIDDIKVQYTIPVKKLNARVSLLEWYMFNRRQKGYYPLKLTQTSKQNSDFDTQDHLFEIIDENIPAIIEEPYVNNLDNYASALQIEVTGINAPKLQLFKNFSSTWEDIAKDIYKSSSFGGQIKKVNYFKDDLNPIVSSTASIPEKVVAVFQFAKQKIKWNGNYGKYTNKGVRMAYKEGTGNVAEVNLALVSMLRHAGLNANPILVSTRGHGIPLFPTTKGFNYVIACVEVQNDVILLDATEPYSEPNVLPKRDLNWQGRIVRESGSSASINLFPKKHVVENNMINIVIDADGTVENGLKRTSYTDLNALHYRNNYNNVSNDDLIGKFEEKLNIEISELKIQNQKKIGKPVVEMIKFDCDDIADVVGDKMYINPLLFLTEKENPFKLDKRSYPIDFGTPWEEKATINIKLPEGYSVESLPEKMAIGLPENIGTFRFITVQKGDTVQILCSTKVNMPIIAPQYYDALKDFYSQIIQKETEKIVIAKSI